MGTRLSRPWIPNWEVFGLDSVASGVERQGLAVGSLEKEWALFLDIYQSNNLISLFFFLAHVSMDEKETAFHPKSWKLEGRGISEMTQTDYLFTTRLNLNHGLYWDCMADPFLFWQPFKTWNTMNPKDFLTMKWPILLKHFMIHQVCHLLKHL